MTKDPELVQYFQTGLVAMLAHNNHASAREHFMWCITQIDSNECDLYRAIAHLDANTTASDSLVESIYNTRSTWGQLLGAVVDDGRPLREDSLHTKVNVIPELDITLSLCIRPIAHIGYASLLVRQSRYAGALEVLEEAQTSIPMIELVKAYVHFKAERWQDVIDHTQHIESPMRVDAHGTEGRDIDTVVQATAYLFSGIAYAHLGNFVTAEDRLRQAESFRYKYMNAEACYYLGLIARAKGDEDTAAIIFNTGIAYTRTDKLLAAAADPTITLRQTTAELIKQRGSYWDVSTEPDLNEIQQIERAANQNALLADAAAELNRQIGMTAVKDQIRRFEASVAHAIEEARRGRGGNIKSMHMTFMGPPGTGKTTIARVVAKILCGLGLIKNEQIREVRRADLVGSVIGETEVKTNAVIDSALDGVLFIDEAYALAVAESKNDFGKVAINELLARMENERDRLVVIIAGYPDDIKQLLAINDGLSSRFTRHINFSSYSPEEIGAIAEVIAAQAGWILPQASHDMIVTETRSFLMVSNHDGKRLLDVAGNGRFVRNILEKAAEYRDLRHYGMNLRALSDDEVYSLMPEDVQAALRDTIDPLLGIRSTPPTAPATTSETN